VVSTVIDLASGVTLVTGNGKVVHRVVYSVRNTSKQFLELALDQAQLASQAENEIRFSERLRDVQTGGATTPTGVLPIRVQIPTSGELYRFAGTLISGEPMTLSLTFVAGGLTRLVLAIVLAAAAISIYFSVRRFRRNRRRRLPWPL
jgi:hypothetical protein